MIPDELAARARELSPRQARYLRTLADGQPHGLPYRTGEALRRRGYVTRISTLVLQEIWKGHDAERAFDYGVGGKWVHQFYARGPGFALAQHLDRLHRDQLAPIPPRIRA
jgi:hypothetical protein